MSTKQAASGAQSPVTPDGSIGRESHIPFSSSPSTSHPTQASASPARRSGLMTRIFGSSRDKEVIRPLNPVVTVEGSITQSAWAGISRGSPMKTRIKTLMQLQDVSS
ncbi:hypothetical protein Y032_0133g1784 [Ancylostoma ceylanicum]|uniref:Uncharacterized protein n=1 Tax=Ancylostoma ceylanicum TaxID=53326 RepID=A0A016T674_9BILA|nr:hypothetical protein Y032_0133g1784 [Ancylostoma ceylanicum]